MVKLEQAVNGVAAFIEAKIFPSLNLATRTAAAAALTYVRLKPVKAANFALMVAMPGMSENDIMRNAKELELVDDEYSLDVDMLIEMAKNAAKSRDTGELPIEFLNYGIKLNAAHFDEMKDFIKKAGC